jgi:hypothetical protein
VGAGGSQDAAFTLLAAVPAGTYHCVLDAIVVAPVDVTFDLIWRSGPTDTVLVEWSAHYDPPASGFDAQAFEYDEVAPAIANPKPGDQLVFRYTGNGTTNVNAYIPNGDGTIAHGRIPNITLP